MCIILLNSKRGQTPMLISHTMKQALYKKTIAYIFNVDHVNDNEYTKYDLILPIRSQDIE